MSMALFITQGRYSSDAVKGLIAKPEDRAEEVGKLIAAAGGKLQSFYYTLGEYDFLIIAEGPNEKDVVSSLLVAAANGTVTDLRTSIAIGTADMKQCFAKAGTIAAKFRPPGK
jgi:uncharacterized protein with GYD domain